MFADAIQRNDPTVVNPVVDERSETQSVEGQVHDCDTTAPSTQKDYWLHRNARQRQLRCQISQWMHQRLFSVFCQWGPVAILSSGSRNFERGIQCIGPNVICCKCTYLMNYIYIFCTGKGDLLKKVLRTIGADSPTASPLNPPLVLDWKWQPMKCSTL